MSPKPETPPAARSLTPASAGPPSRLPVFPEGPGALVCINQDTNGQVWRSVSVGAGRIPFPLLPGLAYPLPIERIDQLLDEKGNPVAQFDKKGRMTSGTKGVAWYFDPQAQPVAVTELQAVSKFRLNTSRTPMRTVQRLVDAEWGPGYFVETWNQGQREYDAQGQLRGRAGGLEAVQHVYEALATDKKIPVDWDAMGAAVPAGVEPVTEELYVVRHTGEVKPTLKERDQAQHAHDTQRIPPPALGADPKYGTVVDTASLVMSGGKVHRTDHPGERG